MTTDRDKPMWWLLAVCCAVASLKHAYQHDAVDAIVLVIMTRVALYGYEHGRIY